MRTRLTARVAEHPVRAAVRRHNPRRCGAREPTDEAVAEGRRDPRRRAERHVGGRRPAGVPDAAGSAGGDHTEGPCGVKGGGDRAGEGSGPAVWAEVHEHAARLEAGGHEAVVEAGGDEKGRGGGTRRRRRRRRRGRGREDLDAEPGTQAEAQRIGSISASHRHNEPTRASPRGTAESNVMMTTGRQPTVRNWYTGPLARALRSCPQRRCKTPPARAFDQTPGFPRSPSRRGPRCGG